MRWSSTLAAAIVVMVVLMETQVTASRILLLEPFGMISHKNFYMGIAEALAARNHTVTFVTGFKGSKPKANIREVFLPNADIFKNVPNLFTSSGLNTSLTMISLSSEYCCSAMVSEEFKMLQEEKFDLVMISVIFTECFYSFVYKLQVPYIHMVPNILDGPYSDMAGNPHFSAIAGNMLQSIIYPFTFFGRMASVLFDLLFKAFYMYYMLAKAEAVCRERQLCPDTMPSVYQMRLNGSLFIVNSVETMETPIKPYVSTVIHAGGIHCRPAKPIPQDLEEWFAGAGDAGVIFFSLGSVVTPSTIPEKHRRVLVEVFGSLEQRVLWKWDQETMHDLPPNVRLAKWLPQQDVLGDSRLRMFITHGGLLSTQEATFHGVPVLGIPVFADQHKNLMKVQQEGWGRFINWEDLTYDNLRQEILEVLHSTKLREEVGRRSAVMRDLPLQPGPWVTYWVEYVIRHHGAPHLRSPLFSMPWYELYNVDVWLVVLATVFLLAYVTLRITRALCNFCCRRKQKLE